MATIDDAKAAFDAYHEQVTATIANLKQELAAAQSASGAEDAQPLLDDIAAAQQEIAPQPPAADAESAGEDAAGDETETGATLTTASTLTATPTVTAPAVDTSVKWNE